MSDVCLGLGLRYACLRQVRPRSGQAGCYRHAQALRRSKGPQQNGRQLQAGRPARGGESLGSGWPRGLCGRTGGEAVEYPGAQVVGHEPASGRAAPTPPRRPTLSYFTHTLTLRRHQQTRARGCSLCSRLRRVRTGRRWTAAGTRAGPVVHLEAAGGHAVVLGDVRPAPHQKHPRLALLPAEIISSSEADTSCRQVCVCVTRFVSPGLCYWGRSFVDHRRR